jgi:hypothetical protein
MRPRIILHIVALLLPLTLVGCSLSFSQIGTGPLTIGSGTPLAETRLVDAPFHGVAVHSAFLATIRAGAKPEIELTADDNIVPLIETVVQEGILVVRPATNHSIQTKNPLKLVLTVTALDHIEAHGASRINVESPLEGADLDLALHGASQLNIPSLTVKSLKLKLEGASRANLAGSAASAACDLAGASHADAQKLRIGEAAVALSGASHLTATVTGTLSGSASGASHITLTQEPASRSFKTSGASHIKVTQAEKPE